VIKKIFFIVLCTIITSCGDTRSVPEKIMDSVIVVDSSSGIVVYSDGNTALVLTANHVVEDKMSKTLCSGCAYSIDVRFSYHFLNKDIVSVDFEYFDVVNIETDPDNDLAIIEIKTDRFLDFSLMSKTLPRFGEDLWLGSNPNFNYRSIKKGVVSSPERYLGNKKLIEVSGGIIYGSSGGGAFNAEGKLFGVIHSVDQWKSPYCYQTWTSEGMLYSISCVSVPISDIGYVTNTQTLNTFVLSGTYQDYFYYLR
jgi:hypothetical protein